MMNQSQISLSKSSLLKKYNVEPKRDLPDLFNQFVQKQMTKKNKVDLDRMAQQSANKIHSDNLRKKMIDKIQKQYNSQPEMQIDEFEQDINEKRKKNLRIRAALDKVKQRLKLETKTKQQKFESKFNNFEQLDTFIDIKKFLVQIQTKPVKNEQYIDELSESSESSIQSDILDYNQIIDKSKQLLSQYPELYQKKERKQLYYLKSRTIPNNVLNVSEENSQQEMDCFYKSIDRLIDKTNQQINVEKEEKKKESRRNIKIEKHRMSLFSDSQDKNKGQGIHDFQEKCKKVIQLLNKATKQIYNNKNRSSVIPPERNSMISPENSLKFKKIISSERKIKRNAVSLPKLHLNTNQSSVSHQSHTVLHSKGNQISEHETMRANTIQLIPMFNQGSSQILKHSNTRDMRYMTSGIVLKQRINSFFPLRQQIQDLIDEVGVTQREFLENSPKIVKSIQDFATEMQRDRKVQKSSNQLECLRDFSKSEKRQIKLSPRRLNRQKVLQIL